MTLAVAVAVAGVCLVVSGVWVASPAAALVVAGLALLWSARALVESADL